MMDSFIQISAILLLICSLSLWLLSFMRGRRIVRYMQRHHMLTWEKLGNPKPDYLSPINNKEWSGLLSEKKYLSLNDRKLAEMCSAQHRLEKWTLAVTISFFALAGGAAVLVKFVL